MPKKGYKATQEHRDKISKAGRGRRHTIESRKKISIGKVGECNPNWHGGIKKNGGGYIAILSPTHPNCDPDGYVYEHRLAMEAHIGRTLVSTEVVHHINGIVDDNRIENLMLFSSSAEHHRYHAKQRRTNASLF